ncbi:MAG: nickel pincer cofactor biosynthesis protein LarB [Acidaminococcales bacterium]|jgi:NCAIR mutase (PurE)-related protein|nr:nickel pincer cofactor biosynthesis protein LarB [Acidaminococcales bacterium]
MRDEMDGELKDISFILRQYKTGRLSHEEAMRELSAGCVEDLGFAKIDHARMKRQGFPEVVYCEGKGAEQVTAIVKSLAAKGRNVLASRAGPEFFAQVKKALPDAFYNEQARMIVVMNEKPVVDQQRYIAVITAGTSDAPVAEEAALTAEVMGNKVERVFDVGVAGIHRLFANLDLIRKANVCVVAAGMEGALASVVGGLVDKPVIAVPTSVGYGANFGGLSALLSMLNSCAAGVGVVNIDNGFGAGRLAALINKMR